MDHQDSTSTTHRSSVKDRVTKFGTRMSVNGQKIAAQLFARRALTRGPRRALGLRDNVMLWAVMMAVPNASVASLLKFVFEDGDSFPSPLSDTDSGAWAAFSVLVTFLLVFRTSQSTARFWEGCSACYLMRAEWFDSCSALLSFCRGSRSTPTQVKNFQHSIIRMFSMIHGIALAEIEDRPNGDNLGIDSIEAFSFEVLDPEAFDDESLKALMRCQHKVELLYQWIQNLIIDNVNNGVLSAPPPLLTRAYQELGNGMVAFHEALKISSIPVPLPYVQACDWMMMLHYAFLPLLVPHWVDHWGWAFAFCFIQVFILWALKFTASEIDNPFGTDSNDLDRKHLQRELNNSLKCLLDPSLSVQPKLSAGTACFPSLSNGVSTFRSIVARMESKQFEEIPQVSDSDSSECTAVIKGRAPQVRFKGDSSDSVLATLVEIQTDQVEESQTDPLHPKYNADHAENPSGASSSEIGPAHSQLTPLMLVSSKTTTGVERETTDEQGIEFAALRCELFGEHAARRIPEPHPSTTDPVLPSPPAGMANDHGESWKSMQLRGNDPHPQLRNGVGYQMECAQVGNRLIGAPLQSHGKNLVVAELAVTPKQLELSLPSRQL